MTRSRGVPVAALTVALLLAAACGGGAAQQRAIERRYQRLAEASPLPADRVLSVVCMSATPTEIGHAFDLTGEEREDERLRPRLEAPKPGELIPAKVEADALVRQFHQRFYGLTQVIPSPKELEHATALLAQHGEAKAHFLLAFAHQAAPETHYQPQVLGGILQYLPRALAAYDAQAARVTQAAAQRTAADERTWHERYLAWRQCELRQLRAALSPAELAALEDTTRARLVAAGTVPCTLEFSVRFAVDDVLDAQAGLLSFAAWRQTQEACG